MVDMNEDEMKDYAKNFAERVSNELVNVQPMHEAVGLAFSIKHVEGPETELEKTYDIFETVYLIYCPVDYVCQVIRNGYILFQGDYDEVDEWCGRTHKEQSKWIDATVYVYHDYRGFRNDYVPNHPIHPKKTKEIKYR